jgi:hypothetical protein
MGIVRQATGAPPSLQENEGGRGEVERRANGTKKVNGFSATFPRFLENP